MTQTKQPPANPGRFTGSHATYGALRLYAARTVIAGKRVARLMRQDGLRGVSRRRFPTTTRQDALR